MPNASMVVSGVFRTGDRLGQDRLNLVQHDAIVGTDRKGGFTKITFPAGTFHQVADFKIESAFESPLG
jgi:hypothetical protein